MEPKERIILALDINDPGEALNLVERFKEHIEIFKVGSELFTAAGPGIIEEIHLRGKRVFLDMKYHDIPTTVQKTALTVARLGVFMFNIHTMGGLEMMKRTAQALAEFSLKKNIQRPRVLGVTVLTSIGQNILRDELGIDRSINSYVKYLARLALKAGLDGVVISPQEVEIIRADCGRGFLIVTPGIRPLWSQPDDQRRTMTPREAIIKGADYIILGRAIMSQPDPINALKRIEKEIASL
jgi:orotidine-5'-phosphate decarboxylase